jgi:hypothetical protein
VKKLLVLALLGLSFSVQADIHTYQYNDNVMIEIYSAPCQLPDIKTDYPYAVAALRIDGNVLSGCYKESADLIDIEWEGHDRSSFERAKFVKTFGGIK